MEDKEISKEERLKIINHEYIDECKKTRKKYLAKSITNFIGAVLDALVILLISKHVDSETLRIIFISILGLEGLNRLGHSLVYTYGTIQETKEIHDYKNGKLF